jgi:N-hydroxyarylamine O-acetyltransferase
MSLDLDRFAARVGLSRIPAPTVDGLFTLHAAQALAIPFENFDVLLGREIRLEPGALMDKLVTRRRGGYCFELNGLMRAVLDACGFDVTPLLGRVVFLADPKDGVRPRTHQVALARVEGRAFLVDVGFGGPTPRLPIPFERGVVHDVGGERFRLTDAGARGASLGAEGGVVLAHETRDGWRDLYVLTLERAHPIDFVVSNHYTSTHPRSHFRGGPRVARVLADGRLTMTADHVTRTTAREVTRVPTPRGAELVSLLARDFDIELDAIPSW